MFNYKSKQILLYLRKKSKKGMKKCGIVLLLGMMLASCDITGNVTGDIGRTVLIYMAADNDLSSFAQTDIEEMKNGDVPDYFGEGESGDVLLVYLDISGEPPRLYRLSRDRFGVVNMEILREYEEHNSSDPEVMRSVLQYAANLFPADDYGLVLWSHATGWLPAGYYSNPVASGASVPAGVSEDPFAHLVKSFGMSGSYGNDEMDIDGLADALPVKYSYIIFDACLMGGIEVAYELKDKCDYLIFSPAEVLADGMPYDLVLGDMFASGTDALKEVCREFFNAGAKDGAATVSLVSTSGLDRLASVCFDIFSSSGKSYMAIDMNDLQGYFRYGKHWFYDLDDFVSRLANEASYAEFSMAMDDVVVAKYATDYFKVGTSGFEIKKFSGLSTYVPNPENAYLDEFYKTLAWNKAVKLVE